MIKIIDFPKIESPFIRKLNKDNDYTVTPEVNKELEWVFLGNENEVAATEKMHGTCCAILIENGIVTAMFNRTNRIPFIGGTLSKALTEGVNNALEKERFVMQDGLWWGELIGKKIQKNEYQLIEHEWIPFEWVKDHLAYKSWHNYDKTYENIKKWLLSDIEDGGIFSLFMRRRGIEAKPEGIVFHNIKTGQMGKIRLDMFDDYHGRRHKEVERDTGE
jgi:hypothetical protein